MTTQPHLVCAFCQVAEVGVYDLVCRDCRPTLVAAGVLNDQQDAPPQPDNRIQIGPLDV
jgi:hypothetical protein